MDRRSEGDVFPTRRIRGKRQCRACYPCKIATGDGQRCPKLDRQAVHLFVLVDCQIGEEASDILLESALTGGS